MNKVILIGRVGQTPEIKEKMAKFSLATKMGDKTTWHNCVTFSEKLIPVIQNYVKKGEQLALEGFISTNEVEKDGKKTIYFSIVVDKIELIGGGQKMENSTPEKPDLPF